jgi:hypothetical protein
MTVANKKTHFFDKSVFKNPIAFKVVIKQQTPYYSRESNFAVATLCSVQKSERNKV